jgi:hypothetical protein
MSPVPFAHGWVEKEGNPEGYRSAAVIHGCRNVEGNEPAGKSSKDAEVPLIGLQGSVRTLVKPNRSWMPFLRNFGYLARPARKFLKTSPWLDDGRLRSVLCHLEHPGEWLALDGVQLAAQGLP